MFISSGGESTGFRNMVKKKRIQNLLENHLFRLSIIFFHKEKKKRGEKERPHSLKVTILILNVQREKPNYIILSAQFFLFVATFSRILCRSTEVVDDFHGLVFDELGSCNCIIHNMTLQLCLQ